MKAMTFKMVGTLHVITVGGKDPTQEDWVTYMQAVISEEKRRGVNVTEMRTLVFSDGGGPNAAQRKMANDVLKGRPTPIAVVTNNFVMRGVITALQWFNPQCRAFMPNAAGEALKFLGIPQGKYEMIVNIARELQKDLKVPKLSSLDSARLSTCSHSSAML